MGLVAVGAAYSAIAYVEDVVLRPDRVAQRAIKHARSVGKPTLNVGAGTPGSSLRVAILGPTLWGDVNLDLAAPQVPHGPNCVAYGDIHKIPYPNKHFGAAIASHVLEHVDDPQAALVELCRVADRVYAITPKWWAPHTWLYTDHQWYVTERGKYIPLWQRRSSRRAIAAREGKQRQLPFRQRQALAYRG